MLLRVKPDYIVNLKTFATMSLNGDGGGSMCSIRWYHGELAPLDLQVSKDRAAAQKVFDAVANAWAAGKGMLDWAEVTHTLYQRVRLPDAWMQTEFLARDLEPRFLVRQAQTGLGRSLPAKYLTAKDLRDLIDAIQKARSWPPNGDAMWLPVSADFDEDPDEAQRADLLRTLQAALER